MEDKDWELTGSVYWGVLIGFRIYTHWDREDYALYFPFVNFALTVWK